MNARIVGAIVAIVVLGGGMVAFVAYRSSSEADAARQKIMRAVDAELATDPPDRDSIRDVLRQVEASLAKQPHPELVRSKALLQLALGRPKAALETIEPVATSTEATVDDQWVAARVLARLHADIGDPRDGRRALEFALAVEGEESSVDSAFLAWQLAYRLDDVAALSELTAALGEEPYADTLEARTAVMIEHFLLAHIATRLGLEVTAEAMRAAAEDGTKTDAQRRVARRVLETADAGSAVDPSDFELLFRQWGASAPPEFMVIRASRSLSNVGQPGGGQGDLRDAVDQLEGVLVEYPTFVEARHLISLAYYGLLQVTQANGHLRWLVENANPDDARQNSWRERLQ